MRLTATKTAAETAYAAKRPRSMLNRPWIRPGTPARNETTPMAPPTKIAAIAPFAVAYKAPDVEKLSAYECGFNAFDDSRMKFDVRYYLVAILFIIFDLEIAFLFPWAVSLDTVGKFGLISMAIFLAILVVGFIYEWKKGALEWD